MNKKVNDRFKGIQSVYQLQCMCTELNDRCNELSYHLSLYSCEETMLKQINKLENEKKQLKDWLKELIDKNNDIYELYKDDISHHDYEISNAKYQNNIFTTILEKIDYLESKGK